MRKTKEKQKKNKGKYLILGGGVILVVAGTALLIANNGRVKNIPASSATLIDKSNVLKETAESIKESVVKQHLRNLPEGHHPSSVKLFEAAKKGITLKENQTIVSEYTRHRYNAA